MNKNLLWSAVVAVPLLLGSCVDQAYDLSQIDGTSEFKVTNLTLPLNLKEISLRDLIKDGEIKTVTAGGKEFYAVTESGHFSSNPISLGSVTAKAPVLPAVRATVKLGATQSATGMGGTAVAFEKTVTVTDFPAQTVTISTPPLDPSILSVTSIKTRPMYFDMDITAEGLPAGMTVAFDNAEFEFMKGLTLASLPSNCSYDPKTGLLKVSKIECVNSKGKIQLDVRGLDLEQGGATFTSSGLKFGSEIRLKSLQLTCSMNTDKMAGINPPSSFNVCLNTKVSDMTVSHVSGRLQYNIDGSGLKIPPVDLMSLPDFLNNGRTDLRLANPQIYLSLNNPLAQYNIYFQTGLQIRTLRPEGTAIYALDNDGVVRVDPAAVGANNFVLSPTLPASPLGEYSSGLRHVPFSGLSDVLAGDGLPKRVDIELVKPQIPAQNVTDFDIASTIPGIEGDYTFIAPLALKKGSVIYYGEKFDGWSSDFIEKLKISSLALEADVTNTVPLDFTLNATLLHNDLLQVAFNAKTQIKGNTDNQHIRLEFKGGIMNLCGIKFDAVLSPDSEEPLAPNQVIKLSNIRIIVDGSYCDNIDLKNVMPK